MQAKLIADIKAKLNIQGGIFVDGEIAEYIAPLRPSLYGEFFKALSGEEYAFKKGIDRVAIVSKKFCGEPESDLEHEAKIIATLLHDVNKVVTVESQAKGIGYVQLMRAIDIRATFNLTPKQSYVMNEIGGREAIMSINTTEPNTLERKIIESLKKYERENTQKTVGIAQNISSLAGSIVRRA